jgi:catechol 2,3-dioxygenase-like lactoylglutathione lyase family enzyme
VVRFSKLVPRLPVAAIQPAVDFYTGVLGFQVGLLWPGDAPTFAILERDDLSVQFSVAGSDGTEAVGSATLCFDVSDVRALHASLQRVVPVEWGPEVYWYGRREFAIRDNSGYLIIFSETTADPSTCVDER